MKLLCKEILLGDSEVSPHTDQSFATSGDSTGVVGEASVHRQDLSA